MSFYSPPERHLTDQSLLKFSLIVCFSLELFIAAGRRIRRDRDKEVRKGGISLSLIAEFPPVTARVAERARILFDRHSETSGGRKPTEAEEPLGSDIREDDF